MTVQTRGKQLIIEISTDIVDVIDIQSFINFINYKNIVSKSQATDSQIEEIVEEINDALYERHKHRF